MPDSLPAARRSGAEGRVVVAAGVLGAEAGERAAARSSLHVVRSIFGSVNSHHSRFREPSGARDGSPSMRASRRRSRRGRRVRGPSRYAGFGSRPTTTSRRSGGARTGRRRGRGQRDAGEVEEVVALGHVEVEHPSERVEHAGRRSDVAALLEPRVPGQPDACELRDLLASQPGRAPVAVDGQRRRSRGVRRLAAVAQELGELVATCGWWCESQDEASSCPAGEGRSVCHDDEHDTPRGQADRPRSASAPCSSPAPASSGRPRDPDAARAVLRRAIELGVDHIDTSQYYGPDVVNELIREALHPYPADLKLVTKVGARRDDEGGWLPAHSAERAARGRRGQPALAARRADGPRQPARDATSRGAPGVPLPEQLGELEDLRREGKLDLIGVSNVDARGARAGARAGRRRPGAERLQHPRPRRTSRSSSCCREREIAFVPFFPLGSAFTGGPARLAADPAIAGVAEKHGATPSQVALAWLLARYERMLLIPGTTLGRAPRGEPRRRRRRARRGRSRAARGRPADWRARALSNRPERRRRCFVSGRAWL